MYLTFIVTKLFACILLTLLIPVSLGFVPPMILSGGIVIVQLGLILMARNFKPLAILFLFTLPYIYITLPHFANGSFPLTLAYYQFDNEIFYTKVLVIHSLFLCVITLCLPFIKTPFVLKEYLPKKDNIIVFYGLLLLMAGIVILGRSGTSIFESGGYGSEDANIQLGGGLAIFEYFLVVFPIAYIYSGKRRLHLGLLLLAAMIFSIKGMLFGGRIEAIQAMFQVFILFIDHKALRLRKVLAFLIVPAMIFIIFGFIRSNPNINIAEVVDIIIENYKVASYAFLGNHIDIYYSSTRLYAFVHNGILSLEDRLFSFGLNILAIVVPYGKLPDLANLAAYRQSDYPAGGGGLISVVFYVFLSYPGVILIGSLFGLVIRKVFYSRNTIILLYGIMILCTYPRWFGYSPIVFFKISFYIIPLYLIIKFIFTKKSSLLHD